MVKHSSTHHPSTWSESVLADHAVTIRQSIVKMLLKAKSGHSAGALGMTDVFTALYFVILKHNPTKPWWSGRDLVLLSNGHICPVWYATLAEAGYFPKSELQTLRQIDSRLQGHPHLKSAPGVENTSGPLGQGISQACGLALSLKIDKKTNQVYCFMSDAEFQEGQTWEAFLLAYKYRLDNMTVLIDRNTIQIEGSTETVMPLEPLQEKLLSFGWHVQNIDGHNFQSIIDACNLAKSVSAKPSVIICNTIPGKGVSFMESDYHWHGLPPNQEQAAQALSELRTVQGQRWSE